MLSSHGPAISMGQQDYVLSTRYSVPGPPWRAVTAVSTRAGTKRPLVIYPSETDGRRDVSPWLKA